MNVNTSENKLGFLNILVLILSVYVLGTLLIDTFFQLPDEISRLIDLTDHIICAFFLLEFCIRFYQANSKLEFMKWGWIDLIASIPAVHYLRAGRVFRLIRILRVIRGFRSTHHLVNHIFRNKATGTLTTVTILTILFIFFSMLAMLIFENAPNSNLKTAEDAFWWAWATVTTSYFGPYYPVTTEGRIIGGILKIVAMGFIGTFVGYAASLFIGDKNSEKTKKQ